MPQTQPPAGLTTAAFQPDILLATKLYLPPPRPGSVARPQLVARLEALDLQLADDLAPVAGHPYIVFHDAYQYLEHRYGLHPLTAITSHPERRPGAAHLSELNAQLSEHDVRCLFSEPQFDSRLIARLSEGRDVRHSVLDPLGSHLVPGPHAYDELMHQLAAGFSRCLGEDK